MAPQIANYALRSLEPIHRLVNAVNPTEIIEWGIVHLQAPTKAFLKRLFYESSK